MGDEIDDSNIKGCFYCTLCRLKIKHCREVEVIIQDNAPVEPIHNCQRIKYPEFFRTFGKSLEKDVLKCKSIRN